MASRGWEEILPGEKESGLDEAAIDPAFGDDQRPTVMTAVDDLGPDEKTSLQATAPHLEDIAEPTTESRPSPIRMRSPGAKIVVKERRRRSEDISTPDAPEIPLPSVSSSGRKLRLPLPGEVAKSASTPEPVLEQVETPPPAPREIIVAPAEPPNARPQLAGGELMQKLAGGSAEKETRRTSFYAEYKEVIHTSILGLVIIAAGIAFQMSRSTEPAKDASPPLRQARPPGAGSPSATQTSATPAAQPAPSATADPNARTPTVPTPNGATPPIAKPAAAWAQGAKEPSRPTRSATPMLSVISTPPGASVEINGVVYGNTPLIQPSPVNIERLSITIRLDDYKKWEKVVAANAAGHFTVNAKLEPSRPRR